MKIELTFAERAILANQFRILAATDAENKEQHLVDAEVFESGFTGLYQESLQRIGEEVTPEICKETHEILGMYRMIDGAIGGLSPEIRETLDLKKIKFQGFDANNDRHYHFMTFMIDKQGKYQEHNSNYINSHNALTIHMYRNMLKVYKKLQKQHVHNFSLQNLQEFIDAA